MRFKLVLEKISGRFLPLNYQYAVSSWIYRKIREADPEYSHFLHKVGYEAANRQYKLFTFGRIESYPYQISQDRMELQGSLASIIFSFMADRAAENFIKGIFIDQVMAIRDPVGGVVFRIVRIETLPYPVFGEEMVYQAETPICISHRDLGDRQPQYLHPGDARYKDLMIANLIRKYSALHIVDGGGMVVEEVKGSDIEFELLSVPRQKLAVIKPHTAGEIKVRGYQYRFRLKAPVSLQEVGYYAGFGEKNSMGMGWVDYIINN